MRSVVLSVLCVLMVSALSAADAQPRRILIITNFLFAGSSNYLPGILEANGMPALVLSVSNDAHASAGHNYENQVGFGLIAGTDPKVRIKDKKMAKAFPGTKPDVVFLQVDPRWDGRRKDFRDYEAMQHAVAGYAALCQEHGVAFYPIMTPGRQMLTHHKHNRRGETEEQPAITAEEYAAEYAQRHGALTTLSGHAGKPVLDVPLAFQLLRTEAATVNLHPPCPPYDGHLSYRDHYFVALVMAAAVLQREPEPALEQVKPALIKQLRRKVANRDKTWTFDTASDEHRGWITVTAEEDAVLRGIAGRVALAAAEE